MKKNIQQELFLFVIIASEFDRLNCLYQEENTSHRHSVCYETVLRFSVSLNETFCKTTDFAMINKYGKRAVLQISTKFGRIYHVAFWRILWKGTF